MLYEEALQHVQEAVRWRDSREPHYSGYAVEFFSKHEVINKRRNWFPIKGDDNFDQACVKRYIVDNYKFEVLYYRKSFKDDVFTYGEPITTLSGDVE